jgi:hypothetical protein
VPSTNICHNHFVYGLRIRSDIPLALPAAGPAAFGEVTLRASTGDVLDAARDASHAVLQEWCTHAHLPDGRTYVGWSGIGQFLVSADGGEICYHRAGDGCPESFQVYMLNQALSFALLKRNLEPLHATAVVVDGGAIALFGESGRGKSTLASGFLQSGFTLLTDDVLIYSVDRQTVFALPGPPRVKLFPDVASGLLDSSGVPMNAHTSKLIVPLPRSAVCISSVPLVAGYELAPEDATAAEQVTIGAMNPADAVVCLSRHAFNRYGIDAARRRHQFLAATALAARMRVSTLSYPRIQSTVGRVVQHIVADVRRERRAAS